MEQQTSTSTVTVEYFDPHDVYKLLAPGLVPRLPLRNLHWQSHAGPLRSIETLHVELIPGGGTLQAATAALTRRESERTSREDGFQTQHVGGSAGSNEAVAAQPAPPKAVGGQRRHQIPGLRRTPYLKILLVRCDDNDSYKASVRSEIREWIKLHTPPSSGSKKSNKQEKHDAFEWLIVHVVLPNTAAATQPRSGRLSDSGVPEKNSASSRWRTGSTPLMEKLRSDFNSSSKGAPDRIAQIRIGINDVPYDMLPRVVPAVPSGYSETEQDAENAWSTLVGKLKGLILSSFDKRVTQYEDDIREKDGQRTLPGWNFCTFFILKEGLARGFESVGLVEDALVGYDELGVGLDSVILGQAGTGSPESHGGVLLNYTQDLRNLAQKALAATSGTSKTGEAEDLQSKGAAWDHSPDDIVISSTKKAYRDMILANKVSVFDFRCYIFARQISLLLRLGNASSTREELLTKLKVQQESVLRGVAPLAPPARHDEEPENLSMLAEICRRTLEFLPSISQVMRQDILAGIKAEGAGPGTSQTGAPSPEPPPLDMVDNFVSSFAFSVAQQILAQTSSRALPIPPTTLVPGSGEEQKASIPEPKTMMHPVRSSSLHAQSSPRRAPSPAAFPGPGRRASVPDGELQNSRFLKVGLEELAARRAELYMLSRSVLRGMGQRRGWSDGWDEAPIVDETDTINMDEISLKDEDTTVGDEKGKGRSDRQDVSTAVAGVESQVLHTAMNGTDDFYRLYEILTDKALRHFTVASYERAVQSCMADLACLKFYMKEYKVAATYFFQTTPFFGRDGWCSLELSMLVMYAKCLGELHSDEDFMRVALKLLTKACAAERARLQDRSAWLRRGQGSASPDRSPLHGIVDRLSSLAKTLPSEIKVPLESFLTDVHLTRSPEYHDRRDACSLSVTLHSLLPEHLSVEAATMKLTSVEGGPCRNLTFEKKGDSFRLAPGKNHITLDCNSVVPGRYKISHLGLLSGKLCLQHDSDVNEPAVTTDVFKDPEVRLFQRTGALDVRVRASKSISLDKNNSLDLELSTGWNRLESCEIRVRPATGGLRLLMREAQFVDSTLEFAKPPESGAFFLGPLDPDTSVTLRFPYSVEQDVADVLAKLEVTYVDTSGDSFYLAKSLTVPVSLALGVNVQDVFKHQALFSRFNVSTASSSPIYLHESELLDSELFESAFGVRPGKPITVFPKQPASLLYRVKRKPGTRVGKRSGKTMYLRLYYTVLQAQIEDLIGDSVAEELAQMPGLKQYSRLVVDQVQMEMRKGIQAHDLERAALLGEMTTAFLENVAWEKRFVGLGTEPESNQQVSTRLAEVVRGWRKKRPQMVVPSGGAADPRSILIPVEVPALSVVHTANMRLQGADLGSVQDASSRAPTVCVNQMLPATLHLKWTRAWDTETAQREEQEFGYEVTAPADTWLLGGRRRGRFVIPASSPSAALSSTAETEAEIPLILIPQREGWLPYPTVEIREILLDADGQETTQPCEVDWRNLGETVRTVKERKVVTVSLDASGPGGGPLVFESEGLGEHAARIVA
ncbi:hypothetical protein CDD83_1358 [Cordyceps sp. RAO-2017]|nr:hypothetical protein CDD83_1358 [Cordyceps sp. RAO-2017]